MLTFFLSYKPFLSKLIFTVISKKCHLNFACPTQSFLFNIIISALFYEQAFPHHSLLSKQLCNKFIRLPTCIISHRMSISKKDATTVILKYFILSQQHIISQMISYKFFFKKISSTTVMVLTGSKLKGQKCWVK